MATVRVKSSTPKIQKTKQVNSKPAKSYTPRAQLPRDYSGRGGTNGMAGMINTAANHPAETLGYLGGLFAGNYAERGRDRYQGEEESRVLGNILGQFGNQSQSPESLVGETYGGMNMNANADSYLGSGANSVTPRDAVPVDQVGGFDDAARAGQQATQAGMQMAMSGQPMTAAAVTAMGLSPVDQAKQAVVDGKMRDFAEYGPNASRARRQEEQAYQMTDRARNMDLSMVPASQLEQMIDQQLSGTKMSWNRRQAAKANILKKLQEQGAQQANDKALDAYYKTLTLDPNSQEYRDAIIQNAQLGTDFIKSGQKAAGELLMKQLIEQRTYDQQWQRKYAEQEALQNLKYNDFVNRRDYTQATSTRGSSGTGGTRGRKSSSVQLTDGDGNEIGMTDKEYAALKKEEKQLLKSLSGFEDKSAKAGKFDEKGQPLSGLNRYDEDAKKKDENRLKFVRLKILSYENPKEFEKLELKAERDAVEGQFKDPRTGQKWESPQDPNEEGTYFLP